MARLNESIVSEINCIPETLKDIKVFLKWLMEFERENSDKSKFQYKSEILEQIEEIIGE
jgi:primase-polymerase (primpol)-like protein